MVRILQSPEVLKLQDERIALACGQREPAKYTTRELIRLEAEMVARAQWLSRQFSHGVPDKTLSSVFKHHDRLSEECDRGRRYGDAFALIVMDIDHFKHINDTFGHDVGDAVLGWVSSGALHVRIGRTYPLAQAAEAHRALAGRETTGKVLLLP